MEAAKAGNPRLREVPQAFGQQPQVWMIVLIVFEGNEDRFSFSRVLARIEDIRAYGRKVEFTGEGAVGGHPVDDEVECQGEVAGTRLFGEPREILRHLSVIEARVKPHHVTW